MSIMICAALSGFLFGYDTSVINGALFQMKDHFGFNEHSWQYGFIVSIAIIGCFVGSFTGGIISTYWGRRPSIAIADVFFITGSIIMAFAPSVTVLLLGRVMVGLAIGVCSVITPVYLAEVTPPGNRGSIIVLNNIFLTGGQFVAASFAAVMVVYTSNNVGWRIAVGIGALPAILQIACLIHFLPESPRWLAFRGHVEAARLVAERCSVDFDDTYTQKSNTVHLNYCELFKKDIRFRLILSCTLQIIQQFSGINTIMYYSSVILYDAGFQDPKMPVILSIPLAFLNALFTCVAVLTVDKVGRRFLLIVSCIGCIIATAAASAFGFMLNSVIPYSVGGWLFLFILSIFLAFYAPGIGCIPWVMMGEIFPIHLRTSASSIATMANWGSNVVVSQAFPVLMGSIGMGGIFAIIVGLLSLGLAFIWFYVLETNGLSLREVDRLFRKHANLPVDEEEDEMAISNNSPLNYVGNSSPIYIIPVNLQNRSK
ncbi:unnamed protein product [Phytomonas sp. Hart1]|nr:unnamed protein product [Phytomonas sp. Hart1]|eukprot:CCW66065.1 unnamed protein product [Phytomonas sp. isolate Hart1]